MYYFPNPFINNEAIDIRGISLSYTVASGKQALSIALKSFDLPAGSAVAIPAFCCNEVVGAVSDAGHFPVFFDLKEQGSYWAEYKEERLREEKIKVVIITHLYGYLHPDTQRIADSCAAHGIKLIHDAAQSYGIDERLLMNAPLVYSFGPGKSTTAARGGELLNVNEDKLPVPAKANRWDDMEAKAFFTARTFGAVGDRLMPYKMKIAQYFRGKQHVITGLSPFQKEKAIQAKAIARNPDNDRKKRYNILSAAIESSAHIRKADAAERGLSFKIVIFVEKDTDKFTGYLKQHAVPYCRLADSMNMTQRDVSKTPIFNETFRKLIEISTERSIPMDEINRIATLLSEYK